MSEHWGVLKGFLYGSPVCKGATKVRKAVPVARFKTSPTPTSSSGQAKARIANTPSCRISGGLSWRSESFHKVWIFSVTTQK